MISGGLSFLPGNCQLKLKNRRFSDITDFTQIFLLYSLSRKNFLEFFFRNISWICCGDLLGIGWAGHRAAAAVVAVVAEVSGCGCRMI